MTIEIKRWLADLGLAEHTAAFIENGVDEVLLPELDNDDLKDLGVNRLKDRKILLAAVAKLDETSRSEHTDATEQNPSVRKSSQAERRHLTVMFVDLVGSTALSSQVDPEDLREIITNYQNVVAGCVTRFDGHVAKYMGDGVLCYFGWPRAHEDDPERAVRAGLGIVEALAAIPGPDHPNLAVRIGVATGLVVVGDLIGEGTAQEEAVVGETPNLAARLQGIAHPGEIIIAETTRKLVGDIFELKDSGTYELKGIAGRTAAFVVAGERTLNSRFEARVSGSVSEMVGRDHELGLILERWRQSQSGEGQLVLLLGEAGIGKSRIARAAIEAISIDDHVRMTYQCSPYHADSALYPAIQQLAHAARFTVADSNDDMLDKLEAVLLGEDRQPIARLLDLETEQRYGPIDSDPQQLRWRTLRALTDELVALSNRQPVLFVLEDAHWIDATTLEMIELCLDSIQNIRVLILVTARPTFQHRFSGHPNVVQLTLNRLSREQIAAIAVKLAGGKTLPDELLEEIATKTDGVPLFVEELTKTVLESGILLETGEGFEMTGPVSSLAIPATLHDSLMARLDRLQPVKEVAQMAACIGREFEQGLLSAISPLADEELESALQRLLEAELIFRRGLSADGFFIFKHALVRDAAYESLLKTRRKAIHAKLLAVLEGRERTVPELLASHAEGAEAFDKAIGYWQQAGEQALLGSAVFEAIAHLKQARTLVLRGPETAARNERELEILKNLGSACIAAYGYGAAETIAAFDDGLRLTEQVARADLLFPILYGQYVYRYIQGGGSRPAYEAAKRILDTAALQAEPVPKMIGHRCVGMTLFCQGRLEDAKEHFGQALDLYSGEIDHNLILEFGTDSKVSAQAFLSTISVLRGFPDQARALCAEVLEIARQTNNVHTLEYCLFFGPIRRCFCLRELTEFSTFVAELSAVADDNRLPMWQGYAATQQGWLLAQQGEHEAGIALLRAGIDGLKDCGVQYDTALATGQLAEACLVAGQHAQALAAVDQAIDAVSRTNERWFEPEVHRLHGEILVSRSRPDSEAALAAFNRSREAAHTLGAKWWELRATTSLVKHRRQLGLSEDANDLLRQLCSTFSEGQETVDVKEARSVLGVR